jgi:hypothetical protein
VRRFCFAHVIALADGESPYDMRRGKKAVQETPRSVRRSRKLHASARRKDRRPRVRDQDGRFRRLLPLARRIMKGDYLVADFSALRADNDAFMSRVRLHRTREVLYNLKASYEFPIARIRQERELKGGTYDATGEIEGECVRQGRRTIPR